MLHHSNVFRLIERVSLMYVPFPKAALFLISFHIFSLDGAFINLLRVFLNTIHSFWYTHMRETSKIPNISHVLFFVTISTCSKTICVTHMNICMWRNLRAIVYYIYIYANPENKWYSTLRRCEGGKNDMNISISLSRLFRAILLKKSNSHYRFDLDDRPWKTSDMLSTKCYANLTLFFSSSLSCSDLSKDWL